MFRAASLFEGMNRIAKIWVSQKSRNRANRDIGCSQICASRTMDYRHKPLPKLRCIGQGFRADEHNQIAASMTVIIFHAQDNAAALFCRRALLEM